MENNQYIYNHPVPTKAFFFSTFSTGFNKLHEILNIWLYKTGFELDDFTQLQANVSALSTFKVGNIKLWYSVD